MRPLTPKQMGILDRAVADLGRTDLAGLMARIRAARQAEFREHVRRLVIDMAESRERRRARIADIRGEVRKSSDEWQRQLQTLRRLRWETDEQSNRHRPRDHQ